MLPFQPPQPQDRQWVTPLLTADEVPLCDYSFPALYCWQDAFQHTICPFEGRLLTRLVSVLGNSYLWPVGSGDAAPAIAALAQDAQERGEPLRLVCVPPKEAAWLAATYPGVFTITETRDSFDYIYDLEKMSTLSGKKLHGKRNHIHRFDELCPGWTFAPMTPADIPACRELDELWYQQNLTRPNTPGQLSLAKERHALDLALTQFHQIGLEGGAIRFEGRVVAFALGSRITSRMYNIHFERADATLQGAYPAIAREMARWVRETYPGLQYLDREDDMGLPGLRKAKLSFFPHHLGENVSAVAERFRGLSTC